jgi:hypothetical protein
VIPEVGFTTGVGVGVIVVVMISPIVGVTSYVKGCALITEGLVISAKNSSIPIIFVTI